MTKFDLGVSSIDFTLYQRTPKSSRKSSLSQSRLNTFLTPSSSSQVCPFPDCGFSESSTTKLLPTSHVIKGVTRMKRKKSSSKKISISSRTPTSFKKKKKKKKRVNCQRVAVCHPHPSHLWPSAFIVSPIAL